MSKLIRIKKESGKRRRRRENYRQRKTLPPAAPWFVCTLVVFFVFGLIAIPPLQAQPLDDVIENLLDDDGAGGLCEDLLGAGVVLATGGPLDLYCAQGGSGTPSSTGGGASTPNTAPGIVQERLQAVRGDQDERAESGAVTELLPGWSMFLSAEGEALDRDVTIFEDGYDSDIWRVTIGTDFQLTNQGTIGLAVTYSNHEGDFTGGGAFENDSYGFIAFASFVPHEKMFVQATAGYAWKEYNRTRTVSASTTSPNNNIALGGSVNGDFDANEFSTSFLAGYDYTVGGLTIGPRIGLDWIHTEFDGYIEQGSTGLELVFDETDETSFQSRVGFVGNMAISTGFGVLVPQVSADWVHEFADAQRSLAFRFAEDTVGVKFVFEDEAPDTNFFELAAGISAVLPNGWLPYIQYRTIVGHDFLDSYVGSVGLRKEF